MSIELLILKKGSAWGLVHIAHAGSTLTVLYPAWPLLLNFLHIVSPCLCVYLTDSSSERPSLELP